MHLHPQHVLLVDMLGAPIRFTTLDHQFYLGSAGRVPFLPSGSQEVADAAAEAARDHEAVVLAHHGCSAFGESMSMALRRALNLEEAATMTYRLLVAGDTTTTSRRSGGTASSPCEGQATGGRRARRRTTRRGSTR